MGRDITERSTSNLTRMILDELSTPIVLAPLAGGPSTPELVAAVGEGGGFGFLGAGYLSAGALADQIGATRALSDRPFGVNLLSPVAGPADPDVYAAFVERLRARHPDAGEPRFSDDEYGAK